MQIIFNQRVPMRDGVTLSADIYHPSSLDSKQGGWPVVLLRTPYVKASTNLLAVADLYILGYE